MRKDELLAMWAKLPENQNPLEVMRPLPPKFKGKTFGLDGVRIDGSIEFIKAVMSCLKPLIDGENCITRLQLAHTDCKKAKGDFNKGNGGNALYIRLHYRTAQGSAASTFFDRKYHSTTERFAALHGIHD